MNVRNVRLQADLVRLKPDTTNERPEFAVRARALRWLLAVASRCATTRGWDVHRGLRGQSRGGQPDDDRRVTSRETGGYASAVTTIAHTRRNATRRSALLEKFHSNMLSCLSTCKTARDPEKFSETRNGSVRFLWQSAAIRDTDRADHGYLPSVPTLGGEAT
jgi:hypothetical protein